jgi:tRNA dimethylallyltransferase
MGGVPHHLYGTVPAGDAYSTGKWLRSAARLVDEIRARGRIPVFVGGTGLYFRALTSGLADMPDVPADIREKWRQRLAHDGPEALHMELQRRDPRTAETLSPTDGQRIVRALEILEASGRSIVDFRQATATAVIDADRAEKIVVLPDRKILHARINSRFEKMVDTGAVEEVRALLALKLGPAMPVMKAIGVPQIADLLAGRLTRDAMLKQASAATRQYAKRQMTWFRNQMDESWQRVA